MNGKKHFTTFNGNSVFIIGNGFDMSMGRKATFADFFQSEYWPEDSKSPLSLFIKMWGATEYWFDMERYIDMYASNSNTFVPRTAIEYDKSFFEILSNNLKDFISSKTIPNDIQKASSDRMNYINVPMAYHVFDAVLEAKDYSFFSFNYTDMKPLCKMYYNRNRKSIAQQHINSVEELYDEFMCGFEYVHGSIQNGDIIIGSSGNNTHKDYLFLDKVMQIRQTRIVEKLSTARRVVIFGHSLSKVDMEYLNDFLQSFTNPQSQCESLLIFTKDWNSIVSIKSHLKEYNAKLEDLWKNSKIQFYTLNDLTIKSQKGLNDVLYSISRPLIRNVLRR